MGNVLVFVKCEGVGSNQCGSQEEGSGGDEEAEVRRRGHILVSFTHKGTRTGAQ